jgi:uncharacterized membrane protein
MAVGIVAPRLLRAVLGRGRTVERARFDTGGVEDDTEVVHALDLAWCAVLSALGLVASRWIAERLGVPMILVLTALALVLAQMPVARRLRGARLLGMFGVYLFLAVIGALCDVAALRESGELGFGIFLFVCVVLAVHGCIVFGAAALLRLDLDAASVASQANVGGGTSALALARSLGRPDLVLPAILVGSLGTALGTFLGVFAVERLL